MPLIITLLAGAFILLGAPATKLTRDHHKVESISFALAMGALVALMSFDLVPDIIEAGTAWWLRILFVAIGFVFLVGLDHIAPDHEEHHEHESSEHIGVMSAMAVILHNIVEGMTVYTMSMGDVKQGLILAVGIGLHNIPMGMLIFSTLDHKGMREKLIVTLAVVLSTPIGGLLMMLMSSLLTGVIISALVCVAAGMIIYLVIMELLPHILKTKPASLSIVSTIIGFVIVMVSCLYL